MKRLDFERIAALIPAEATVLDLGCAEGDMLAYLQDVRQVRGMGADIDSDNLVRCFQKGVQAVHCDIRQGLAMFDDGAFDTVVLSDTLQSVHTPPQKLLSEMLRIGRAAIVSFPNFGYWQMRLQLLSGKMPGSRALPHSWHDTPNVRYCTIYDFEMLCQQESLRIRDSVFLCEGRQVYSLPNLRAEMAIYCLERV
ncbi:MAG: methionine biosynthesis protein MetW [Gammaproteobacteria bacterium WSBS_2016_MAG_OTU1]